LTLKSPETITRAGSDLKLRGRALFLVSGGIDSPVAAWLLIRKGIEPVFAYFDNYPLCDQAAEGIALDTIRKVCNSLGVLNATVFLVSHSPDLQEIVSKCPPKYACVLSRRIMLRVAEQIAERENCTAIVTGDSIGQKASQTLQNITSADCVLNKMNVLRPLVGMNKEQIVKYAMQIGTYETSIRPGVASCGVPTNNPSTAARRNRLAQVEGALDVTAMVRRDIEQARVITI
jgi:thiamine biosynthesis protein ThiI